VQAEKPVPSKSHMNVDGSFAPNEKLGDVSLDGSLGAEPIVAVGAVRSTVHDRLAEVASVFPAGSVARTLKVCVPSARPEYAFGLAHGPNPPPSRSHAKLDPASLAEKANDGPASLDGSNGAESIVVSGGVVSTVHS
jgi:hypothetical protein